MDITTLTELIGKTLVSYEQTEDTLNFIGDDGANYLFYHNQDCCELVQINDVVGDLNDLLNSPILKAEVVVHEDDMFPDGVTLAGGLTMDDSSTWTFYKFATIKGYVDVRWIGLSNGYYSESVTFRVDDPVNVTG